MHASKELNIGFIGRYIFELSDIVDTDTILPTESRLVKKSPIFPRNIKSIPHVHVSWNFWKNIGKYRKYIGKISEISEIHSQYFKISTVSFNS